MKNSFQDFLELLDKQYTEDTTALIEAVNKRLGNSEHSLEGYCHWIKRDPNFAFMALDVLGNSSPNSIRSLSTKLAQNQKKIIESKSKKKTIKTQITELQEVVEDLGKAKQEIELVNIENEIKNREKDHKALVQTANKFVKFYDIYALDFNTKLVEKYIEIKTVKDQEDKLRKEQEEKKQFFKERVLSNQEWAVYFLMILGSDTNKRAKLSKAILNVAENNKSTLKIEIDGETEIYSGLYDSLRHSNVSHFDLFNEDKSANIHINILFKSPEDEVILGILNFSDQNIITSHRIVLYSSRNENSTPQILSYRENENDFSKVKDEIKNLLSLRKNNYLYVPRYEKRIIRNLKTLEDWQDDYDTFKNKENRFLESSKPILFIACPSTNNPDVNVAVKFIRDEISKSHGGVLDVQHKDNPVSTFSPESNLKSLRRTRLFVLIIPEKISSASFSLVQLGWTLSHAKHTLLCYNEEFVSKRFNELQDIISRPYHFKDIVKEKELVIFNIRQFIDSNTNFKKHKKKLT